MKTTTLEDLKTIHTKPNTAIKNIEYINDNPLQDLCGNISLSQQLKQNETLEKHTIRKEKAELWSNSYFAPKELKGDVYTCYALLELADHLNVEYFYFFRELFVRTVKDERTNTIKKLYLGLTGKMFNTLLCQSKRFSHIQTVFSGEVKDRTLTCVIKAYDLLDNAYKYGDEISLETARLAGWIKPNNLTWKTMPKVMLQYRAIPFFIRKHIPHIANGLYTSDEIEEILNRKN